MHQNVDGVSGLVNPFEGFKSPLFEVNMVCPLSSNFEDAMFSKSLKSALCYLLHKYLWLK